VKFDFFKALSKAKERVRTPVNEIPAIEEEGVWVGEGHAVLTKGNKISHSRQVFKIKHFHSIRKKEMGAAMKERTPKSSPKGR